MKPFRTVLYVDLDDCAASCTKLFLESRHHKVLTCCEESEAQKIVRATPVDVVVVGRKIDFNADRFRCPVIFSVGMDRAQLLERIRIAVTRKRGPKPMDYRKPPVPDCMKFADLAEKQAEMQRRWKRKAS